MADNGSEIISNSKKDQTIGYIVGGRGSRYPVIEINGYSISQKQIRYLEINNEDILPKANCTFNINDGVFISKHFPKDGDMLSVFIRSLVKDLKPVRVDFRITHVTTSRSTGPSGDTMSITVYGEMWIPKLYASFNKAFPSMNTLQTLIEVANDLGLGFVTNVTDTDLKDTMTWLSPNQTYLEFIKSVVSHSYSNEYSFFSFWFDHYYNLNFVEMNSMFSIADSADTSTGIDFSLFTKDTIATEQIDYIKNKNILSNLPELKNGGNFIEKHELFNQSGASAMKDGYIKNLNIFDFTTQKHVNFNIESTVTNSKTKKIALKGRPNEDIYKNEIKKTWSGWNYLLPDHNIHEFYKEAAYQNRINNENINKIKFKALLSRTNLNYYSGQRVPIIIVNINNEQRVNISGWKADDAKNIGFSVDRFLSGNYIIRAINLIYKNTIDPLRPSSDNIIQQEVVLSRREWTHPNFE